MKAPAQPLNRGGVALGVLSVVALDVVVGAMLLLSIAAALDNGGYFGEPTVEPSDLDGLIWIGFLASLPLAIVVPTMLFKARARMASVDSFLATVLSHLVLGSVLFLVWASL